MHALLRLLAGLERMAHPEVRRCVLPREDVIAWLVHRRVIRQSRCAACKPQARHASARAVAHAYGGSAQHQNVCRSSEYMPLQRTTLKPR